MKFTVAVLAVAASTVSASLLKVTNFHASCNETASCSYSFNAQDSDLTGPVDRCEIYEPHKDHKLPNIVGEFCHLKLTMFSAMRVQGDGLKLDFGLKMDPPNENIYELGTYKIPESDIKLLNEGDATVEHYTGPKDFLVQANKNN